MLELFISSAAGGLDDWGAAAAPAPAPVPAPPPQPVVDDGGSWS